jgi:hypothetical protein
MGADGTVLMLLPFAALRARILVPVGSAEDVRAAVAIHVERCDAFGVIRTEPMNEESGLRDAIRAIAGCGVSFCLRVRERGKTEKCDDSSKILFHRSWLFQWLFQWIQLHIAEEYFSTLGLKENLSTRWEGIGSFIHKFAIDVLFYVAILIDQF